MKVDVAGEIPGPEGSGTATQEGTAKQDSPTPNFNGQDGASRAVEQPVAERTLLTYALTGEEAIANDRTKLISSEDLTRDDLGRSETEAVVAQCHDLSDSPPVDHMMGPKDLRVEERETCSRSTENDAVKDGTKVAAKPVPKELHNVGTARRRTKIEDVPCGEDNLAQDVLRLDLIKLDDTRSSEGNGKGEMRSLKEGGANSKQNATIVNDAENLLRCDRIGGLETPVIPPVPSGTETAKSIIAKPEKQLRSSEHRANRSEEQNRMGSSSESSDTNSNSEGLENSSEVDSDSSSCVSLGAIDADEGAKTDNTAPRTKNEIALEALPLKPIDFQILPEHSLKILGTISSVVDGRMVVIASEQSKSEPKKPMAGAMHEILANAIAIDIDSPVVFEDRVPLGRIFDTFGPVQTPFYTVRCDISRKEALARLKIGARVFYISDLSNSVCASDLRSKGYDSSNVHDEEIPEHRQEYSDDEAESSAKRVAKNKSRLRPATMYPGTKRRPPNRLWLPYYPSGQGKRNGHDRLTGEPLRFQQNLSIPTQRAPQREFPSNVNQGGPPAYGSASSAFDSSQEAFRPKYFPQDHYSRPDMLYAYPDVRVQPQLYSTLPQPFVHRGPFDGTLPHQPYEYAPPTQWMQGGQPQVFPVVQGNRMLEEFPGSGQHRMQELPLMPGQHPIQQRRPVQGQHPMQGHPIQGQHPVQWQPPSQ